MKLVIISDTHGRHNKLDLPDGDVLIHCGDFTTLGYHKQVRYFLKWLLDQPHKHKIFIAGNHDLSFERERSWVLNELENHKIAHPWGPKYLSDVYYLENSHTTIDGLVFYGSPYTPAFNNWAFMMERNGKRIQQTWAQVPNTTDVLITHGPPKNYLDQANWNGFRCGCKYLAQNLARIQPKIHCFGHVHEGYGMNPYAFENTVLINASICDLSYDPVNKPVEIEIAKG